MRKAPMLKETIGNIAIDIWHETAGDRKQTSAECKEWVGRSQNSPKRSVQRGREACISLIEQCEGVGSQPWVD